MSERSSKRDCTCAMNVGWCIHGIKGWTYAVMSKGPQGTRTNIVEKQAENVNSCVPLDDILQAIRLGVIGNIRQVCKLPV